MSLPVQCVILLHVKSSPSQLHFQFSRVRRRQEHGPSLESPRRCSARSTPHYALTLIFDVRRKHNYFHFYYGDFPPRCQCKHDETKATGCVYIFLYAFMRCAAVFFMKNYRN